MEFGSNESLHCIFAVHIMLWDENQIWMAFVELGWLGMDVCAVYTVQRMQSELRARTHIRRNYVVLVVRHCSRFDLCFMRLSLVSNSVCWDSQLPIHMRNLQPAEWRMHFIEVSANQNWSGSALSANTHTHAYRLHTLGWKRFGFVAECRFAQQH